MNDVVNFCVGVCWIWVVFFIRLIKYECVGFCVGVEGVKMERFIRVFECIILSGERYVNRWLKDKMIVIVI